MGQDIILVGGFHEIIELCENCGLRIVGIIDNNINSRTYFGYDVLGKDQDADTLFKVYKNVPLVITPDSPNIREKLFIYYSNIGFKFISIVSNKANISRFAKIGNGVIVQDGVNISANSELNDFVKVNTNANIMHDVTIGRFVTVAPNAVVLGNVKIDNSCYIGANSTILPNIKVSINSTIGAGAVLTKDTTNDCVLAGVPAKQLYK